VDAYEKDKEVIKNVKVETLSDSLQTLSVEELEVKIKVIRGNRASIQNE